MANKICEISSICRLCLFDDKCILFPMSYLIDSSLTEEDIERFTGIELFGEEHMSYTICVDCANKLKKCASFRTLCLNCDVQFQRMFEGNRKECISTENDSATVELSVEPNESAIHFVTAAKMGIEKSEELTIDGNDKNSNVDLAEPPEDEFNVSEDDWADGFEVNSEQHNDELTDRENIKPEDDEDTNSTSKNNEEDDGKVSSSKVPKSKTSVNANTTSDPKRFYRRCTICERDVSDLKRHVLTHEKDGRFACPHCPHKMSFRTHLKRHIRTVHQKEIGKTCEICGLDFLSPISYKNHMTSKHGAGEYECEVCSKKFTHIRAYNIHVRRSHRRVRKKKPKQLCGICGAMVASIDMHTLTHTQERRYSCPHCPLKMVDAANLARHVQSVHLQKTVRSCEICNMGFKYHSSHRSHMLRTHGIGKTFDCKQCPRKFNVYSGLAQHRKRAHGVGKKYACKTCGMELKTSTNLKMHQRVHSTERPFACNQCPKRFKSRYGRSTHQLTHSGIVFSCPHCERSYRYKDALGTHIRQKHPQETITVNTSN